MLLHRPARTYETRQKVFAPEAAALHCSSSSRHEVCQPQQPRGAAEGPSLAWLRQAAVQDKRESMWTRSSAVDCMRLHLAARTPSTTIPESSPQQGVIQPTKHVRKPSSWRKARQAESQCFQRELCICRRRCYKIQLQAWPETPCPADVTPSGRPSSVAAPGILDPACSSELGGQVFMLKPQTRYQFEHLLKMATTPNSQNFSNTERSV